jgi:dCTP deaminase
MILCDWQIAERADAGMITPFVRHQVRSHDNYPVISYGLSSFGYDMRVADQWQRCAPESGVLDPKEAHRHVSFTHHAGFIVIPSGGFVLCRSVEHFAIPDDVSVVVVGKSTYARCGIIVNVTPLEAGWRGHVTIELSNTNTVPVKVYANEGIAQCIFHHGERPRVTYADRSGKYQDQAADIVKARV